MKGIREFITEKTADVGDRDILRLIEDLRFPFFKPIGFDGKIYRYIPPKRIKRFEKNIRRCIRPIMCDREPGAASRSPRATSLSHLQEILHENFPMVAQERFRMKLHSILRIFLMGEPHDQSIFGVSRWG